MSKHWVEAGDLAGLLARFWAIRDKGLARMGKSYPIVVILDGGLDGVWIHRSHEGRDREPRCGRGPRSRFMWRRRRAKTDKIDG